MSRDEPRSASAAIVGGLVMSAAALVMLAFVGLVGVSFLTGPTGAGPSGRVAADPVRRTTDPTTAPTTALTDDRVEPSLAPRPGDLPPVPPPPAPPSHRSASTGPSRTAPGGPPPTVAMGPGGVRFGTDLAGDDVSDPRTRFDGDESLVVSATLRDVPGSQPLVFEVFDLTAGDEQRIARALVPISDPTDTSVVGALRLPEIVPDAGLYEVRYLRDGVELASGRFVVTG